MSINPKRLQQIEYFNQRPWAFLNAMGELVAHGFLTDSSQVVLKRLQLELGTQHLSVSGYYEGWYYRPLSSAPYATLLVYDEELVAQTAVSVLLDTLLESHPKAVNPLEHFRELINGKKAFSESDDILFFEFLRLLRTSKKITSANYKVKQGALTPEASVIAPMHMFIIQANGLSEEIVNNLLEALEYKILSAHCLHRVVLVTRTEEHQEIVDLLRQIIQEELLLPLKTIEQVPLYSFRHVSALVEDLSGALQVSVGLKPQQDRFLFRNIPLAMAIYHSKCTYESREMENDQAIAIRPVLEDPELIHTALVFFKSNLNVTDTANALYIHRNTLLYRLQKIAQLTGYDLKHFDDAMNFSVVLGACSLVR